MYAGFRLFFNFTTVFFSHYCCRLLSLFSRGNLFPSDSTRGDSPTIPFGMLYVWNMWCVQSRTQTPTIRLMPFGVLLCCVVFRVLMFIRVVVPIKFLLYIFINPYLDQITALRFSLPSFDVRRCVARASSKPNYIVRSRIESIIKHGKSQS